MQMKQFLMQKSTSHVTSAHSSDGTKPEYAVVFLAARKAMAVDRADDETVLGADTIVVLDDKILGKPKDREDAFNMLRSLSGRVHSVFTGVCAVGNGISLTFAEETKVSSSATTSHAVRRLPSLSAHVRD